MKTQQTNKKPLLQLLGVLGYQPLALGFMLFSASLLAQLGSETTATAAPQQLCEQQTAIEPSRQLDSRQILDLSVGWFSREKTHHQCGKNGTIANRSTCSCAITRWP